MNDVAALGIHHVGHVVADLTQGLQLYRRLGFTLPGPSYPAVESANGTLTPFGAANTHADFPASFLEVASFVPEGGDFSVPADAHLVPLQAPADALPRIVAQIEATTADLAGCLDRFEGCHILVFATSDIDAVAERLTAAGVGHGGVATIRRPVETPTGTRVEVVRVLELNRGTDDPPPEGRIGFASRLDPEIQRARVLTHANGASAVADVLLAVAPEQLDATQARYETYLDRSARVAGRARTFLLEGGACLSLVDASDVPALLPGERPVVLPAVVACAVLVEDVAVTGRLLEEGGFRLSRTATGDIFVPSAEARGVALIFR